MKGSDVVTEDAVDPLIVGVAIVDEGDVVFAFSANDHDARGVSALAVGVEMNCHPRKRVIVGMVVLVPWIVGPFDP